MIIHLDSRQKLFITTLSRVIGISFHETLDKLLALSVRHPASEHPAYHPDASDTEVVNAFMHYHINRGIELFTDPKHLQQQSELLRARILFEVIRPHLSDDDSPPEHKSP